MSHSTSSSALALFTPAVAGWFSDVLGEPTPPQEAAWPLIKSGRDVVVAAPTGSGKTMAAFLAALDTLAVDAANGTLRDEVRVVYVSPLKALSNDVAKNLLRPLEGVAARLGSNAIRVAVRTGDTPQKERAQINKLPPHVLVTTPESLFVLLGSASGQQLLSTATTLILDEVHAVCGVRRGAHLAVCVERLDALVVDKTGRPLQRIGLSATQKPIDLVARFVAGAHREPATVVDAGHRRQMDLAIEVPDSPLEAIMSNEVFAEVVRRLAILVEQHTTTLVFVNSRRMAERLAARLEEAAAARGLPAHAIGAHHGSMSKDKRLDCEQRLKAGALRALVATSSLELGIDVGTVDLVCQLGSTKTIAAFLQRIGRAGHHKSLVPKGRLFPLSRDELADAGALLAAVDAGALDALIIPRGTVDVVAQHAVAAVAAAGDVGLSRTALRAIFK
ncbi:MAG TPA: DEAD/DEAH box helicase, partial [Myxococcota bacterium]